MTTAQVLEFLQIGRTKLWGLVRSGAISAYRIGDGPNGSLRYRHEEIMDWLEKQRVSNGLLSPRSTEQVARVADRDI
jgi:predicted DNA-binding transcriptional regulator AlpA